MLNKLSFIFIGLGTIVGYAYYYFVGCRVGSCPITSNPYLSTLYGSLLGFVLYWMFFSKNNKDKE